MRVKKEKLVIAFHTTADAMKMEEECKKAGIPGRLIPVPREISAGCGMAWSSEPDQREALDALMQAVGIAYEDERICLLWK